MTVITNPDSSSRIMGHRAKSPPRLSEVANGRGEGRVSS
jgi:hypothetical protein